jgi:RNA polymerase-binding transcription factor DksA
MTKAELRNYRKTLFELGRRLGGDFARIHHEAFLRAGGEARGSLSNVPLHLADLGTDSFEQDIALGLLENEGQILEQIKAALARIEQGTFGQCEECQQSIPVERLRVVPYAPFCVECARALEGEKGPPGSPGNL